ncbi:MAG: rhodanese-like domain-containing protein [Desulfobacteraceae bacterium]|nr:rhodanese-like domain-containing protein [Desulfobacteraceae bacterium]
MNTLTHIKSAHEPGRTKVGSAFLQGAAILVISLAISLCVNALRKDGLPLKGDWSPKAQLSGLQSAEEPVVTLDEARALFLTNGAVFIDARPAEVYLSGHIKGALNLPSQEFEEHFSEVMAPVPPDSLIITYCDGESCTLSKDLAMELSARGYGHTRVLVNGWSVWLDSNLPSETGGK